MEASSKKVPGVGCCLAGYGMDVGRVGVLRGESQSLVLTGAPRGLVQDYYSIKILMNHDAIRALSKICAQNMSESSETCPSMQAPKPARPRVEFDVLGDGPFAWVDGRIKEGHAGL